MRFAIIDDEKQDYQRLSELIEKYSSENKTPVAIDYFDTPSGFLNSQINIYDILFIDIDLPEFNGLELSSKIREKNEDVVIFLVTNYASLAIKGYDVNAFGFLVKPVKYIDLKQNLNLGIKKSLEIKDNSKLVIKIKHGYKAIKTSTIFYIEVSKHNVIYHTKEGTYETRDALKNVEEKLVDKHFVRCSNNTLVNLGSVSGFSSDFVVLQNKEKIEISRKNKKEFADAYISYLK